MIMKLIVYFFLCFQLCQDQTAPLTQSYSPMTCSDPDLIHPRQTPAAPPLSPASLLSTSPWSPTCVARGVQEVSPCTRTNSTSSHPRPHSHKPKQRGDRKKL